MLARRRLAAALALAPVVARAQAPSWPRRQVTYVVPFPPGGTTDLLARLVAERLAVRLSQPVVVENRPGGTATVGSRAVARAEPDGHTILMSNIASHGIAPALVPDIGYDPRRDFAHVALIGTIPNVLLVNPALPARTLPEFIALAKTRPGGLSYASPGAGSSSHLTMELLKRSAGVEVLHVPYRGTGPALNDLLAGTVHAFVDNLPTATGHIRGGTLRPLGVTSLARAPGFPDIPTFDEQGLPGFSASSWQGVSAPASTPAGVVAMLNAEIRAVLAEPAVAERLRALEVEPGTLDPAGYAAFIDAELTKWATVVREAGIRME
ncbi:Bug family tripartite tricarboxylate transporter substrate binding protein [Falsiroseomonas sp. HW251]|uniref:Bug family tripartite tricarboxylate transporter substrate binding protein n=1 Tax=Falsiroseomonas sp. HW251 TaxID=3390998 RepID=UPI003D30FC4B